jgi:hypothetical protein
MKAAIIACVALLCSVATAGAEIVTVIEGWTVVYHVTGEPTTQFYGDGTYLFMSQGPVYRHQTNWIYIGMLGEVTLPEGFPKITFPVDGQATQVMVVPPPPAPTCGTRPTSAQAVVVVGGLTEGSEVIGPFANNALATTFARRLCHGEYSIAPLKR